MGDNPETSARRAAILEASKGVFLRFGYRKTSMDDLARAAGLSRQGLYLHFATKEALFREAVLGLIAATHEASRAALAREDLPPEERILGAFEAAHGHLIGQPSEALMNELIEASVQLLGPVVEDFEASLVADVARVLRATGIAARWKGLGLSARDLASNLHATSRGLKHRPTAATDYHPLMRHAVRIVCRGAPREDT
jgi:AcrR family transcriptional regulator